MTIERAAVRDLLDLPWVGEVASFDEVDSTNAEARRRVEGGAGPGLVVLAERQHAGRGRRDRTWVDVGGGNLAFTAVVDLPARPPLLSLAAALAMGDLLADPRLVPGRDDGFRTSWKWPNDLRVVVDGQPRKCSGILVETATPPAGRQLALVGIGIDVDWRDAGREGDAGAWISLAEAAGDDVATGTVAVLLATHLGSWLDTLADRPDRVQAAAVAGCDTLGRRVRVEGDRAVLVGTARDLTADGALVLDVDGRDVVVTAGDVVHLRHDARP